MAIKMIFFTTSIDLNQVPWKNIYSSHLEHSSRNIKNLIPFSIWFIIIIIKKYQVRGNWRKYNCSVLVCPTFVLCCLSDQNKLILFNAYIYYIQPYTFSFCFIIFYIILCGIFNVSYFTWTSLLAMTELKEPAWITRLFFFSFLFLVIKSRHARILFLWIFWEGDSGTDFFHLKVWFFFKILNVR